LVAVVVIGVIVGVIRPRESRFGLPRAIGLVCAAAIAQVVGGVASGWVHAVLQLTSLAFGLVWLALQRRHLAQLLLAVGFGLNLVVIVANGGMPVDPRALAAVGRGGTDVADGFLYEHVAMTRTTRLAWLGDRLPVPIQGNVISLGDVVLAVAIGLWVADVVGGWRANRGSAGAVHGQLGGGTRDQIVGGGK
jgi:hypothetical protein